MTRSASSGVGRYEVPDERAAEMINARGSLPIHLAIGAIRPGVGSTRSESRDLCVQPAVRCVQEMQRSLRCWGKQPPTPPWALDPIFRPGYAVPRR